MKKQWFAITITVATAITALLMLFWLVGDTGSGISAPVLAAPLSLTVTTVDPAVAPNDIDTPIVIQGTGFTATLSGTVAITAPTVTLGDDTLPGVIWVDTTTLSATVPWGMVAEVYTLTVVNPDGISATLQNAFTVTEGFDVWTTGGPYGGDIMDIQKKPGTPTTVYAVPWGVGLFVSENGGELWELLYPTDDAGGITFDAQNPTIMYSGANIPDFARTFNDGETWESLESILAEGKRCTLVTPVAHPSLAGVIYAGLGCASNEPPFSPGEGGVFRSGDYGDNWIAKTNGMTDTDIWSLAIHPVITQTMLAGTRNGNLYASTDGGENWSLSVHLGDWVMDVYFNPYQPLEAWATTGTELHNVPLLYSSTNLIDWNPVIIDPSLSWGPWPNRWDMDFLPGAIWATSIDAYSSIDGGTTWISANVGANVLAVTPDDPLEIYAASGKGIRKSEDGGLNWRDINEGLAGIIPDMLAASPSDLETVFVKTGQGFFRSFNGGNTWQEAGSIGGGYPGGDYLRTDPFTPTRIYLGHNTQCNNIFCFEISPDAGETWDLITSTLPITYAGWDSNAFAVAPHPQIPGRILVGNTASKVDSAPWMGDAIGMVYASDDYGQTWTHLGPTQPISFVRDIAYDAVDPNLVYMATDGSGLWKSTDGGATWQATPHPDGRTRAIEIAPHPSLSGHLVLATSDQNNGTALYASQDAGETWTFLTTEVGVPILYAPTFPPILYGNGAVPQNFGLVRSLDDGRTWQRVDAAPRPVRLATATDGERVVLYIGTAGGLVTQAGAQTVSATNSILDQVTIFGGGVYRLTTLLPDHWVYLPLVLRGHTP